MLYHRAFGVDAVPGRQQIGSFRAGAAFPILSTEEKLGEPIA